MAKYLTTQGEVLSSEVKTEQIVNQTGTHVSARLKEMYSPKVHYQYTVDGISYENDRFWQERVQINQRDKIEALLSKYPVGSTVTIHYAPDNPSDSFLEILPEVNFNRIWLWVAMGIVFVIIAIAVLIYILGQV